MGSPVTIDLERDSASSLQEITHLQAQLPQLKKLAADDSNSLRRYLDENGILLEDIDEPRESGGLLARDDTDVQESDAGKEAEQIEEGSDDPLISRLVRLHWERKHMAKVKEVYEERYGQSVESDLMDAIAEGDFRDFCLLLLSSGRRG